MSERATQLRQAVLEDFSALEALLRAAALPSEGLSAQFPAGYHVALAEGELVGAVGLERYGRYALLRSLVVRAPERGRGIGRALVQRALEQAEEDGFAGVYLLTTGAPSFFERFRFAHAERASAPEEIAASLEFSSLCPGSATCLVWKPPQVAAPHG